MHFNTVAPAGSAGAPPANLPDFTVQQYASLRVELRLYPDRTQHTLARYRVLPEARARLDRQWRARFDADPALLDAYSRAHTTYQANLTGEGDAAARSPVVQLSLEQYAALWAEMSADPDRALEIQARYGIRTPAAWATTRQHWDTRMAQEPA